MSLYSYKRMNDTSALSDTRTALLDAGRDLFARHGYDGTTVRDLTGRAEVNLGAVTYHFGSKRDLYAAVLEREIAPLRDAVAALGSHGGTGLDRMIRVVELYFGHLAAHPTLPRLLLQEIAAGRTPPEPVVRGIRTVATTLARFQRAGAEDGSVRPGDPVLTALSVISQPIFMNLVLPLAREVVGLEMDTPEQRRAVVAHATDFVRRGLTPPPEVTP